MVGLIIGVPTWTIAKGQWCSNTDVRHKVQLTVRAATASGVAVTPPVGAAYDLASASDPQRASGYLYNYCEGCAETDHVLQRDLWRQP